MNGLGIIWTIIIGLLAGGIAGWLMKGRGSGGTGWIVTFLIGLVGSWIGSWIYGLLGFANNGGILGTLVMSVIGAVVLLFVVSLIWKPKR